MGHKSGTSCDGQNGKFNPDTKHDGSEKVQQTTMGILSFCIQFSGFDGIFSVLYRVVLSFRNQFRRPETYPGKSQVGFSFSGV